MVLRWLLFTAIVLLAFALSTVLVVSGYQDWLGVLRDPGADDSSKQITWYSAVARYVIAFGVQVGTTIFAWEQQKR